MSFLYTNELAVRFKTPKTFIYPKELELFKCGNSKLYLCIGPEFGKKFQLLCFVVQKNKLAVPFHAVNVEVDRSYALS